MTFSSSRLRLPASAVVVLALLAAIVAAAIFVTREGTTTAISADSIRQAYANELRPNLVTHVVYGIDPDQEPESSADNTSVLRSLPDHHFELSVTNTSDTGFINEFSWLPPGGMDLVRVVGSSAGHCTVSANGRWDPLAPPGTNAVVDSAQREIQCNVTLAPPKCSCQAGATVSVDFVAKYSAPATTKAVVSTRVGPHGKFASQTVARVQFGIVNGWVEVDSMTPAAYKIPSYLGGESPQEDLPICARGSKTPCVQASAHGG